MARYQYKYRPPQRRKFPMLAVMFILALVMLIVYPFLEARQLSVDEHTVTVSNLPTNLKNLKIVFVSDIHQNRWFSQMRVNDLIKMVNNLSADIIILGGDYADDSDGAIDFFYNAPKLHARLGVFAIMGNHDRTVPESNLNVLIAQMKNYGCIPLVNEVSRVKVGQTYVTIAGVDDYYNGYPEVAKVAAQVSQDDFVIFAGHTPDLMPDMLTARSSDGDNHWFDLALFGHTHGGQVTFFGKSIFKNLSPEIGSRYLTGWFEENRAAVLVSNGVGTSVLPVRFFAKPQIHSITLKSR
ncbi:MAG: metallophosphoesterase [Clostridiales bacterium]|nr:metallophosphoesterase [Clostridiales bacterium]